MQKPTTNPITQGKHGTYNAVDYSAKPNPVFYAPEAGKITAYGRSGTCGNRLELTGATGRHGFCHLEKPYVKVGQKVVRGQKIGKMGYTGYTIPAGSGGRHLHWVIQRNGVYVYPPSRVDQSFRIWPYPKTVRVKVPVLNARSAPKTTAKIVKRYVFGTPLKAVSHVKGQSVSGISKWYKTSSGYYVWSGGVRG